MADFVPDPDVSSWVRILDGSHRELVDGILQAQYALWLGSGISLGRAESVKDFVLRVLTFLHARVEPEHDGPHRVALLEILSMADGSTVHDIDDPGESPLQWPDIQALLDTLKWKYADVLDVRVADQLPDYLVGIDVVGGYSGQTEPDSEHLFLAVLSAEGVAPQMISANWDGLVEIAFQQMNGVSDAALSVAVDAADLRGPSARTALIKFHGCAIRASHEPARFRDKLIARRSQINAWFVLDAFRVLRARLVDTAVSSPTLMLGLSAQDTDIQLIFADAANRMPWTWPADVGALLFAEERLQPSQIQLLASAYGNSYDGNAHEIRSHAQIGAYAKPLLAGIVALVWRGKLSAYLGLRQIPESVRSELEDGLSAWTESVASLFGDVKAEVARSVLSDFAASLRTFRAGRVDSGSGYAAISFVPTHQVDLDRQGAIDSGISELAMFVGLLHSGETSGDWACVEANSKVAERVVRSTSGQQRKVVLFASELALAEAEVSELWDRTDHSLVTLVARIAPTQQRRSSSAPGRTGAITPTVVAMDWIIDDVHVEGMDDVRMRFKQWALL